MGKLDNKYYYLLLLLQVLCLNSVNAQNDKKFFITRDTLLIENPVIVSFKGKDGRFVMSENYLRDIKHFNIKKLLREGKAYIHNHDFFRFLNLEELSDKLNYNDCSYTSVSEFANGITTRKYEKSVNKFLICFIRIDFYSDKVIGSNNHKTFFSKKENLDYYKIVFPICDKR